MQAAIDVLVVGGGPAGAAAAILLGRYGHRVRLVDRARFPRDRIGESLPPKIEGPLTILGVRDRVIRAGFARMRGSVVHQGEARQWHPFDPSGGRRGYQVERARFDGLLLDEARAAGVTVQEGALALEPLVEGEAVVGARFEGEDVRARWVLDATGGSAWAGRALGLRRRDPLRTLALSGYWRQSRLPEAFEATATLYEMKPAAWIWSLLRQDGLRNVTVGLDASALKATDRTPEAVYHELVEGSSLVADLVARATLEGGVRAHDATWHRVERFARPGLLHVGDAASVIDPLTSQGVYKALQSGIAASAVVNTALQRPEDAAMALDYYEGAQTRFADNYQALARSFYAASPYADEPFWRARIRADAETPPELEADRVAARAARREALIARITHGDLRLRAAPHLLVERRPTAAGGFVSMQPTLTIAGEPIDTPGLDAQALLQVLDGRPIAGVYDGYAQAAGQPPSRELGRRLLDALGALAEVEAVQVLD